MGSQAMGHGFETVRERPNGGCGFRPKGIFGAKKWGLTAAEGVFVQGFSRAFKRLVWSDPGLTLR